MPAYPADTLDKPVIITHQKQSDPLKDRKELEGGGLFAEIFNAYCMIFEAEEGEGPLPP